MSKNTETVTGGLGLEESYFEEAKELVVGKLKALDTISEALEAVAEDLRNEELGEVDFDVSDYEKKLILAGFIMGSVRTESVFSRKLDELEMLFHLMSMSKEVGKDKDGNPILGGAVGMGDLPEELREIFKRMVEENDEDDD